jgi:hypothetical protein
MQILFIRSKVSSGRFYESFTSNKRCKLYVRDNDLKSLSDKLLVGKWSVSFFSVLEFHQLSKRTLIGGLIVAVATS